MAECEYCHGSKIIMAKDEAGVPFDEPCWCVDLNKGRPLSAEDLVLIRGIVTASFLMSSRAKMDLLDRFNEWCKKVDAPRVAHPLAGVRRKDVDDWM